MLQKNLEIERQQHAASNRIFSATLERQVYKQSYMIMKKTTSHAVTHYIRTT